MPGREWTTNDERELRRLHAAGVSHGDVARALDRPRSVIAYRAEKLGLEFKPVSGPQMTAAAQEAAREQRRLKRLKLMEDLQDDMIKLRDQLFAPAQVYNFGGKDNTFEEATLDEPSYADKLKIVQAIATAGTAIEKLEKMDATAGVSEGVAMLDGIAAAIKGAADALRAEDGGTVTVTAPEPDLEDLI